MTKSLPFQTITRYILYALLIFTPLAKASVEGWAVTTIHLATLIALTCILLEKAVTSNWKWIQTPLDMPIICLLVLCLISSAFSMHHGTSLWAMVLLVNYVVLFYLVIHAIRTRSQFRVLVYVIISMAAFLSVFGMFKMAGLNPFPWWYYPEIKYSFLSSTFGNRNHMAGYLEMAIPLLLGFTITGFKGRKIFLIIVLLFVFSLYFVLMLSRSAWASLFIALLFMALCLSARQQLNRKRLILALIALCFVAAIMLVSTPAVSSIRNLIDLAQDIDYINRIPVWKAIIEMITDHAILGTGPGTYYLAFTKYQPAGLIEHYTMAHNDYLHFVSETGVILIPIMVWMLIVFYRNGCEKLKNPSRLVRGITIGAMTGITAILFHSVTDFNLHIPANAILFTVLAALVVAPLPNTRHK